VLFNSYSFIFLYLPIVLVVFFWLARTSHTFAAGWLAIASLFFYGYWNPAFIGLLLGSIVCNYTFGVWIAKTEWKSGTPSLKKPLLVLAITTNLLLLGYYKYANFFINSLNSVAGTQWDLANIILPLGISFFTFTQIAFLVDTYQGKVKEYNFVHYTLFVTYFPHLLAGPVLHHREMMPQFQLRKNYQLNWDNFATGLLLFTLGLCKKTLFADALAPYANAIFDGVERGVLPTIYEAWSGALAYTLQIYFDFSGYTDMALGIALMFNIRLPINFDSPYKATSIIEFWRRWHMTLSRYLRDYLYIPLGGNRKGKIRRYANLMLTMLLGGLWHGAGWTFVLWGALHGVYLVINHLWREQVAPHIPFVLPARLSVILGGSLTFIAVIAAWVMFRSHDLPHAITMLNAMFGIESRPITFMQVMHGQLLLITNLSSDTLAKLLLLSLLWVWLLPNSTRIKFIHRNWLLTIGQAIVVIAFLCLAVDQFGSYSPFLYFQF
jgi:D-alanyl-lipoteichoic acid acyltransferase DltB (MBOAT superfamily)